MLHPAPYRRFVATFALLITAALSGCSGDADDLSIPDLSIAENSLTRNVSGEPNTEADLKLTLAVGDRFPLRKTIDQLLVQKSPSGDITSSSHLAMTFAITIDREDEGRRLLDVNYQRVEYSHELLGERISYDSTKPDEQLPESLQVYKGLVGNGFKFWLGAKNRIVEVEGFDDFLKRCVRFAPAERQPVLLKHIVATQSDEGFSNFVDDSIGLLPYKVGATGQEHRVTVGEEWTVRKQIMRPLPMSVHTTYTVAELTDDVARIEIFGTIFPVKSAETNAASTEIITLVQGHVYGGCVIDRKSGLPLQSRVDRMLDMIVQVPGQAPFKQHKSITTTIEAFPTSKDAIYSKSPELPLNSDQILQTSGHKSSTTAKSNREIQQAEFELEASPK